MPGDFKLTGLAGLNMPEMVVVVAAEMVVVRGLQFVGLRIVAPLLSSKDRGETALTLWFLAMDLHASYSTKTWSCIIREDLSLLIAQNEWCPGVKYLLSHE